MTTTLPVQRRQRKRFPEIADLFAGTSWAHMRPVFDANVMRLEDEMKDGSYEVRAELPGIDPAKDVDITVRDGRLTIKAERTEKKESNALRVQLRIVRAVGVASARRGRGRHQGVLRQGHPDRLGAGQGRTASGEARPGRLREVAVKRLVPQFARGTTCLSAAPDITAGAGVVRG